MKTKSKILGGFAVALVTGIVVLALSACGHSINAASLQLSGNNDFSEVNDYLEGRKQNNEDAQKYASDLDAARKVDESFEGDKAITKAATLGDPFGEIEAGYQAKLTTYKLEMSMEDFSDWGANNNILFPGNLVKIQEDGFSPIIGLERAPGKLSISLESTTGTGGSKSVAIKDLTLSGYRDAASTLIQTNLKKGAQISYIIASQLTELKSEEDLSFALGMNANASYGGFGASVKLGLDFKNNTKKTYAMLLIRQIYYTIDYDYNYTLGANGFFSPSVNAGMVKEAIKDGDIPVYVSSVTYGRVAAITIVSDYSFDETRVRLNASASYGSFFNGGTDLEYQQDSKTEGMTMNHFIYGGSISDNQDVFTCGDIVDMMKVLNAPYDPEKSIGLPISYQFRYLSDNTLAKIGSSAEYTVKELIPIPVKSITFGEQSGVLKDLRIGDTLYLNAQIIPKEAVLYKPTYSLVDGILVSEGHYVVRDKKGNEIATLLQDLETWTLTIANTPEAIGFNFYLRASAGGFTAEEKISPINTAHTVNFWDRETKIATLLSDDMGYVDVSKISVPTRGDATFGGWKNGDSNQRIDFATYIVMEDIDFYCDWIYNIAYKIIYKDFYAAGLDFVANFNPDTIFTDLAEFAIPQKANYRFDCWYTDAALTKKLVVPFTMMQDITLYAGWYRTTFVSIADYNNSAEKLAGDVILDLTNYTAPANTVLTIKTGTQKITIEGKSDVTLNFRIEVPARTAPLAIDFYNISIYSGGAAGLTASAMNAGLLLTLTAHGKCSITAASDYNAIKANDLRIVSEATSVFIIKTNDMTSVYSTTGNGYDAVSTIECLNLTIHANDGTVKIIGSNGANGVTPKSTKNGANGGNGGTAVSATRVSITGVGTGSVNITGGNGGKSDAGTASGQQHGGNGGNGGHAIKCTFVDIQFINTSLTGGDGGNGTNGNDRGKINTSGGNGGDGGNGGNGLVYSNGTFTTIKTKPEDEGISFIGGTGGKAGIGGKRGPTSTTAKAGNPGEAGADGQGKTQ